MAQILDCWYLDVKYLEKLIERYDIELDLDEIWLNCSKIHVNVLIYACFENVKDRFLKERSDEIREITGNDTEDFDDYEIFTNCMDSHLCFHDEMIEGLFQDWQSEFEA